MATSVIVGLSRYRDSWDPSSGINGLRTCVSLPQATSTIMNPSAHHRSYSDAPDNLNRLRLPPISNLIEGVGQTEPSYRSSYQDSQAHPPFQAGPQQTRSSQSFPTPASSTTWPLNNDSRSRFQHEQPQSNDHRPVSEQHYSPNDHHRQYVAQLAESAQEARSNLSHVLPQPILDATSPNGRVTSRNVVREENIPGKGLCWIYDDGTICQKFINGDTVNPKWGTTKAGKPRKRLGQACNTCREKKIKCDPSYPKCTQCQKFGRDCRFEAPSRIANRSPKMQPGSSPTSTSVTEETMRTRRPSVALTEASSHSESGTISSRAAGTADDNLSPLTNDSNFLSDAPGPHKRARLNRMESDVSGIHQMHIASLDQHQSYALETDPFSVSQKTTEVYLSTYFTHVNNSAFCLIPEHHFMKWAEHTEDKSHGSKLVLYSMLSVGSIFSKSSEKHVHGRVFADIALEGVIQSLGHFSLHLIQARLIFALYEFQQGRDERAWDLCGAAMRTACAMNLNTEEGIAQQIRESKPAYDLDPIRFAECMRRTFWLAYTMDSLGTACLCVTTTFNRADFFLRLPCSRKAYESGAVVKTPVFDGEIQECKANVATDQDNVGTLGYLMQIASLCCDVRTLAFRANHRSSHHRHHQYTMARDELESQLRMWNENYTAHVRRRFSQGSQTGAEYPFSFGGLHLVYHYACMQLHRNVAHAHLTLNQIADHARLAYHHAEKTLAIAEQFTSRKSQEIFDYYFTASNPLSGFAVHYAIDILSAAGINTKLLENQSAVMSLILNSVQLLDNLADTWSSARIQKKQVTDRVTFLNNSANAGIAEGKIGYCMEQPMVTSLSKEEDLVYGVDRMQYLKSFDWAEQIQSVSDLNTVSNKGKRTSYSMWRD